MSSLADNAFPYPGKKLFTIFYNFLDKFKKPTRNSTKFTEKP